MLSVGLTGNIASGKSTVARLLRQRHGIPCIDADDVARRVVEPGSSALEAIRARFGAGVIRGDGTLDREALGALIRGDARARAELEAITHPAIYAHIEAWLAAQAAAGEPAAVVEASLLVETGQQGRYDLLVVVSCSPAAQVQRLMATRGMPEATARAWLGTQLPAARKEALADLVIRNDGSPAELERAVAAALPLLVGDDDVRR
jgi:dephospho-CoA kinase